MAKKPPAKPAKKRPNTAASSRRAQVDPRHAALLEQLPAWYSPGERKELAKPLAAASREQWSGWIRTRSDAQALLEGCTWSVTSARRVVEFCRHGIIQVNGRFRGQPLELLPYQWDGIVGPLYGWRRADGTRRFRRGYVSVAKKNGKSGICAGLQLYGLMADQEYGANNFCAALDKVQAGLVFDEAVKYAKNSPKIKSRVVISTATKTITYPPTLSKLGVISSDVGNAEGIDAHTLIYDELHMARTDKLWDVLQYAGAARPNSICPLVITTAGSDLRSLCGQQYKYAKQILAGELADTAYLATIHEAADIKCDPLDPAAWRDANPALGVIVSADDMRAEAQQAIAQGRVANFRRRKLNQWVEDEDVWIAAKYWPGARCVDGSLVEAGFSSLTGHCVPGSFVATGRSSLPCWMGLDLGNVSDSTSLALAWRDDATGRVASRNYFWMPEDTAKAYAAKGHAQWLAWAAAGHLTLTPGAVTDYAFIRERILEVASQINLREIAYDPWSAAGLVNTLISDGLPMVKLPQTIGHLSPAMAELERQLGAGEHTHDGNPVMAWQMANVRTSSDAQGNKRPDKRKSPEKIDGPAALITATARLMVGGGNDGALYGGTGIAVL